MTSTEHVQAARVSGPPRQLRGYGSATPAVVWPDDAFLAINLVVNYEEGAEHYVAYGDEQNDGGGEVNFSTGECRDLAAESVYEYGSRAGVWRLFRLFEEYELKVTFFACGLALQLNPDVGEAISRHGHEPCSHGWRWSEAWRFSPEEEAEEIRRAVEAIRETCGERPVGWYSRYSASVRTRELLVREGGFRYDSNAYNDDLPYFVHVDKKPFLVVPYSQTYNDYRFILGEGGYSSPTDFVDYCCRAIDELWREGQAGFPKMLSIGLHPRIIGQPGRTSALREVIEHALDRGSVWFARRDEIADWWLEHHDEFISGEPQRYIKTKEK